MNDQWVYLRMVFLKNRKGEWICMKKIFVVFLSALMLIIGSVTCVYAGSSEYNTADALNGLGLFLGTGNGYELENGLTRAQGVTLLVRMIGKEEAAVRGVYDNSFTDVPDWAAGYIGYAYENGITNGTGDTTFSPDAAMTDYMFLTLVLRALDYSDKGEAPMFVWDDPYGLAYALDLIDSAEPDTDFTRADGIAVFWNALDTKLNGTETTLSVWLVEQGIFTAGALEEAREIQKNGRRENTGVPVVPSSRPVVPETEAYEPEVPEVEIPKSEDTETRPLEPETPEIKVPEPEVPETEKPEAEEPEIGDDGYDGEIDDVPIPGENETPIL